MLRSFQQNKGQWHFPLPYSVLRQPWLYPDIRNILTQVELDIWKTEKKISKGLQANAVEIKTNIILNLLSVN